MALRKEIQQIPTSLRSVKRYTADDGWSVVLTNGGALSIERADWTRWTAEWSVAEITRAGDLLMEVAMELADE